MELSKLENRGVTKKGKNLVKNTKCHLAFVWSNCPFKKRGWGERMTLKQCCC